MITRGRERPKLLHSTALKLPHQQSTPAFPLTILPLLRARTVSNSPSEATAACEMIIKAPIARALRSTLRRTNLRTSPKPVVQQTFIQRSKLHRHAAVPLRYAALSAQRSFHSSPSNYYGLMPDAEDPKPPEPEPQEEATKPTDISYEEFNEYADQLFETLQGRLEDMQEADNSLEVEYAVRLTSQLQHANRQPL